MSAETPSRSSTGLARRLQPIGIDVRPGEGLLAFALFAQCFLLGTFQFTGKAVRQATYVDSLGAENLPWVYGLVALLAYPVIRLYTTYTAKIRWQTLIAGTTLSIATGLVVFWWLLQYPQPWLRLLFYVWVSIATVLAMSQFWSYAADRLDPRQARRLFGLVSAGGLLGGVAGGQLARFSGSADGRDALLACAVPLVIAVLVLLAFDRRARSLKRLARIKGTREDKLSPGKRATDRSRNSTEPARDAGDPRGGLEIIRTSPLLRSITFMMLLGMIVAQVIDLQFNWYIEQRTSVSASAPRCLGICTA